MIYLKKGLPLKQPNGQIFQDVCGRDKRVWWSSGRYVLCCGPVPEARKH